MVYQIVVLSQSTRRQEQDDTGERFHVRLPRLRTKIYNQWIWPGERKDRWSSARLRVADSISRFTESALRFLSFANCNRRCMPLLKEIQPFPRFGQCGISIESVSIG